MIDPQGAESAHDRPSGRLPPLDPHLLDEAQGEVYGAITGGPRADRSAAPSNIDADGRLRGPFNAMLYSPAVGLPLQELGAALRFRTGFTSREREIATLVVAAHERSDFEWYAHERLGRAAGLSEGELTALRCGDDPVFADARERVVHEATRQLIADGDLGDPLYVEAAAVLGRAGMVELVTLVGYYAALALQMRLFRVVVPEGEPAPEWPPGRPSAG
ncbi:carboxymuconolactone decarboxylase family protein [Actinomadura alba]|uniref:Carboxymuconolactone decarboxylase family protein n=1 Tax=Actinomadura alba TaxID=406431 RepID=A0ABR7LT01_9ACTN|nr:carboxymuconolactone decarboxylase family protein [Actinomadura alba]MBC6467714.1 carboxymuconolactone decarboxylase family protein [Actinomadura alba]